MSSEDTEKELLTEILRVMDDHLAEIEAKLDDIRVLVFITALPTIIALLILVFLVLSGGLSSLG